MLFLSWMMVSKVKYPTFKTLDLARHAHVHQDAGRSFCSSGLVVILREKILQFRPADLLHRSI